MATIRAIDQASIRGLTSGQVILDLQSAVKELIENSLDAGGKNIEIRLKNYGLDAIEVVDDGTGIMSEDFNTIGQRSFTSKLDSFEALQGVSSFGFRGEAFHSLCSVARVRLTTCVEGKQPRGSLVVFASDGSVASQSSAARSRGTTVTASDLFHALPVRRKDFEKNHRREFTKLLKLLQAYALISTGVRITVSVTNSKGKKTDHMKTLGSGSLRQNFAAVFEAKASAVLQELDFEFEVEAEKSALRGLKSRSFAIKIDGLISKPISGSGRTSSDRQFLFVNGRPFHSDKLQKAFNETYRNMNPKEYPVLLVNITLPLDELDVNVSPDKRTVLLHSENNVLDALKTALTLQLGGASSAFSTQTDERRSPSPLFDQQNSTEEQDNAAIDLSHAPSGVQSTRPVGPRPSTQLPNAKRRKQSSPVAVNDSADEAELNRPSQYEMQMQTEVMPIQRQIPQLFATPSDASDETDQLIPRNESEQRADEEIQAPDFLNVGHFSSQDCPGAVDSVRPDISESPPRITGSLDTVSALWNTPDLPSLNDLPMVQADMANTDPDEEVVDMLSITSQPQRQGFDQLDHSQRTCSSISWPNNSQASSHDSTRQDIAESQSQSSRVEIQAPEVSQAEVEPSDSRKSRILGIDASRISELWNGRKSRRATASDHLAENLQENAGIEAQIEEAEATLSRLVIQDDFARMTICGQFNKGFIIARRSTLRKDDDAGLEDDLFLVDQHASDEKFNFESLQADTVLESQRELQPRVLNLSAMEELVASEHLEVLRKNGYQIEADEDAPSGSRIKLLAHPVSQNTRFDDQDLAELLHLLQENPNTKMLRPTKTRAMFASRACRKSVMIGTALPQKRMADIVRHMGTMKQPWSCPHGRPTMRWLSAVSHQADSRERVDMSKLLL